MGTITKIYRWFKLLQLKKNAIFGINPLISRYTGIILQDGSVKSDVIIGNNVMLGCRIISQAGGKVSVGDNSNIRNNTQIWCVNKVQIGTYVIISDSIIICDNNSHPVHPDDRLRLMSSGWSTSLWNWRHSDSKEIVIEDNVWIGKDSKILKGVRIGKNSIVAMGSVVTSNVPENSIVAGNPARVVKSNIDKVRRTFND